MFACFSNASICPSRLHLDYASLCLFCAARSSDSDLDQDYKAQIPKHGQWPFLPSTRTFSPYEREHLQPRRASRHANQENMFSSPQSYPTYIATNTAWCCEASRDPSQKNEAWPDYEVPLILHVMKNLVHWLRRMHRARCAYTSIRKPIRKPRVSCIFVRRKTKDLQ